MTGPLYVPATDDDRREDPTYVPLLASASEEDDMTARPILVVAWMTISGLLATSAQASLPPLVTGIGARKAVWNEHQGPNRLRCKSDGCAVPLLESGGVQTEEFTEVTFGGSGRVLAYTQSFPEIPLSIAESDALALFPSDIKLHGTGVISEDGSSCRWINVTSATLGVLFAPTGKAKKYAQLLPADEFLVELATTDASGDVNYHANDINQAEVGPGWYTPGSGC